MYLIENIPGYVQILQGLEWVDLRSSLLCKPYTIKQPKHKKINKLSKIIFEFETAVKQHNIQYIDML